MRITRAEMLMQIAETVAERSTCSRAKVGAVLVREGRVLSTGYNGAPAGVEHCNHAEDDATGCILSVHAEVNAIAYAARYGVATDGAQLYTTHSPCISCAQIIINSGISRVVYLAPYRIKMGLDLLSGSGVLIDQFSSDMMDA